MTKLVSYNVNGLRAALKKGLIDWIKDDDYDIICIQETKCHPDQIDVLIFEDMGYHHHWHSAQKKGYSGVLTLSKENPLKVEIGMDMEIYDNEGRIVVTHFKDWSLVNVYIPSGSSGEERHLFKVKFLRDFGPWIKNLIKTYPNLVVVGDYNIVHKEIDIHNPQRKDKPSGYRPDERAWLDEWFNKEGFTDSFRSLNPELHAYSWWSYRAGARQRNKGWRIDYISVTDWLRTKLVDCKMDNGAKHSDHCPVVATFEL